MVLAPWVKLISDSQQASIACYAKLMASIFSANKIDPGFVYMKTISTCI